MSNFTIQIAGATNMKKIINLLALTGALLFVNHEGTAQMSKRSPAIPVITEIKVLPGQELTVKNACEKLREEVRREPGCLEFVLCVKKEDPGTLVLFEMFKDEAAFEAHRNEPHTKLFLDSIKGKYMENNVTFLSLLDDE